MPTLREIEDFSDNFPLITRRTKDFLDKLCEVSKLLERLALITDFETKTLPKKAASPEEKRIMSAQLRMFQLQLLSLLYHNKDLTDKFNDELAFTDCLVRHETDRRLMWKRSTEIGKADSEKPSKLMPALLDATKFKMLHDWLILASTKTKQWAKENPNGYVERENVVQNDCYSFITGLVLELDSLTTLEEIENFKMPTISNDD